MEEMLGHLSSFSITEEEAMVIGIPDEVMEKGRKEARFGLLGKILSSKPYIKGSVMSTMDKLWVTEGDLSTQVIDRDTFLFSFEKEQDRAKVLAMEPWSFNESLLILKAVNGNEALRWDSWSFTCFWIRVYNLPYDGMIQEIGEKIDNGIGKFILFPKLGESSGTEIHADSGFWGFESAGVTWVIYLPLMKRSELGVDDTIHVERQEDEGLVFSVGVVEPVKRSVGKWKKEARLKGVHGSASSSCTKLKNAKRKMDVELLAGDAAKIVWVEVVVSRYSGGTLGNLRDSTVRQKKKARRHAWELLKCLRTNLDVPWICGGDFNEVLNPSEVDGGGERSLNDMLLFRETLDWCDLVDMDYVGPKLTWDNRRSGNANIQVRLDRFVANTSWQLKYRRANVVVLDFWGSDHRALLLPTVPSKKKKNKRKSGGFRFEPLWAKNEECPRIVEELWQNLHFDGFPNRLVSGLTSCAGTLRRWGLRKFGNIPKRVARLQRSVELLHNGPRDVSGY
ncbi:hypothetical protein TIFTF001_037707 [Ficus carica]|uniref:DUF4283 domain-containing protein n=1 Tax=Ficus carica TaxID=3494 RepID=A0AA88E5U5_FICCA|nr:hypothetical protein TIFTF001_037707 [Ficus carica]